LRGYKRCSVPFRDRYEILKAVAKGIGGVKVVPQNSLNPSEVVKKYKPDGIASGDGWEKEELEAIKKYKLKKINIKLPKNYSSTKIIDKICKIKIHI